jgi:cyclophilin family peptidyl-prolyl cis-trans isomerase
MIFVPSGKFIRPTLAAITLATVAGFPSAARSEEPAKLYVHMETPGRLSYAGDSLQINLFFKNEGKTQWVNPGIPIEAGFQAYSGDGKKLDKVKAPESSIEGQPKFLEPNAYFGKILDLNVLFPQVNALGTYRITWSASGLPEQSVVSKVIKKYDPARDYQGVIETEFGRIVIEFYKDLAPIHVKNFIDLTNQAFYEGKLFHRSIKGEAVFGGSPTGDERGSPGYNLPPEPNGLKILPGSIAQVRNAITGAEESGCIFVIAAVPQPDMDGRYTVFARVVEGLETVKAIANLPTVGGTARVASRPIKDVPMKKVEIREKKKSAKN